MDLADMPFAEFAHFCGGLKPAVPRFSRPLIGRPAALIALGAAFRGQLLAQQHRDPDEEGHAHDQRRSQRGKIGPHGGLLSGYNRNSMRVLPSVLGFTHSRSRNSATPSS